MVVVAVIGVLATIVYPAYARARVKAMTDSCINNLRMVSNAKDIYAMDHNNTLPTMPDLITTYISRNPICAAGGSYDIGPLDAHAECNILNHTL